MDVDAFLDTQWDRATEFIPVPELARFFQTDIDRKVAEHQKKTGAESVDPRDYQIIVDKTAGFKIQGLTGPEFGQCKKQAAERKNMVAIAEGILSGMPKKIMDSIRTLYGGGKDMTEDDALGFYVLMRSIVEPKIPDDQRLLVIRSLYDHFPLDFRHLVNKALILTGHGHVPGKPQGSTPLPG